jgi:GNAT superfamily N-acetyltransferase
MNIQILKGAFLKAPFFMLFFVTSYFCDSQLPRIMRTQHTINWCVHGDKYVMRIGDQEIGMLSSIQIPILHWCVLYDFFVWPAYRGQGHGHFLFAHAVNQAEKSGASNIFVQPGPFELVAGKYVLVKGAQRKTALNKLIRFYESHQFARMSGMMLRCVSFFLGIVYRLASIDEDPRLLMVYRSVI